MQIIRGVLFEPVGCLAEFPAEPFLEIAARLSGKKKQLSKSGSRAYWHLLNLMETMPGQMDALEMEAVERASLYEDVIPALAELKAMDIQLIIASSLSGSAIARFVQKNGLHGYFSSLWSRDHANGVKAPPLQIALKQSGLQPGHAIFLADTAEGLKAAESVGVNAVLMMNDPDESRRLAAHNPAGGIVSLHELPDFIRIVRAQQSTHPA
jgi:FMN phosphatase YigB (HAD superfamily)